MDGARLRSCGQFVVATLVAFALAMSLPVYGATAASASTNGTIAAHEGPTDAAHQTSRKAEVNHRQARSIKARSALGHGHTTAIVSTQTCGDRNISTIQPTTQQSVWHSWTTDAAPGRAPPA